MKIETIEKAVRSYDISTSTNWQAVRDITSNIIRKRASNQEIFVRAVNSNKNGGVEIAVYNSSNDRKFLATTTVDSGVKTIRSITENVKNLLIEFGYKVN